MDEDFLKLSTMFKAIKSIVRVPDLDPRHKIVVLASKQDHCLVDLLHGWQDGRLPVHIKCVISNHDRGPNTHVMRFLQRHGIPYHYLGTTKEGKREEEILDLVQDTDFIVLARYMQVLHPQSMRPAREGDIPVRVKNSYNPNAPGTLITRERDMRKAVLTSIVLKRNVTMLDIVSTRMLGQFGFLAKAVNLFQTPVDKAEVAHICTRSSLMVSCL